MPADADREVLTVDGRDIVISNPGKVLFPQAGDTKLWRKTMRLQKGAFISSARCRDAARQFHRIVAGGTVNVRSVEARRKSDGHAHGDS
jgi:hypothetical protein